MRTIAHRVRQLVYRPGHPIAPPSGYISVARLALYERLGAGPHPCHWCSTAVDWMPGSGPRRGALVVDHVDDDWHNDAGTNLVPSCQPCNGTRGQLVADDEVFVQFSNRRVRGTPRICEWCGTSFVATLDATRRGRGRFCSQSCARRRRP